MISWFIYSVAIGAIGDTRCGMVKNHILPRKRRMTDRAISHKMILGFQSGMASFTSCGGIIVNAIVVTVSTFYDSMLTH
jgi:hypothetical protein